MVPFVYSGRSYQRLLRTLENIQKITLHRVVYPERIRSRIFMKLCDPNIWNMLVTIRYIQPTSALVSLFSRCLLLISTLQKKNVAKWCKCSKVQRSKISSAHYAKLLYLADLSSFMPLQPLSSLHCHVSTVFAGWTTLCL